MLKHNVNYTILTKLLVVIITTALCTYSFYTYKYIVFAILCVFIIIMLVLSILSEFNKTNDKIAYFFSAIENEDSTLYYPEQTKYNSFDKLHKSLNRLNKIIQDAKQKNKEQEQYYQAILEQILTGIVVTNNKGHILQANSAAKNLLNYYTLSHIAQLKRVDEKLYQAFVKLKDNNRQLIKLIYNNNIRQLSLQSTNFTTSKGVFNLITINDINKELDNKEIEAWIKLIRVLTHEIMNSITPITSLSETIMEYYSDKNTKINEKTIKNTIKGLSVINERGKGLINFVNSYRKLTKIPNPIIREINVNKLINNTILLLKNDLQLNNIELNINIDPKDLHIEADESQIEQVLINIVANSIHALKQTVQPKIKIVATKTEEHNCQIAIMDNGNGITPELLEQIFVPFFSTKEQGSGIGLSLSKQIMKNHGGNIKAYSKPNELTKFVLEF